MENLLPKEMICNIPDIYETEKLSDPLCHIKLFAPDSNWTWYIIELSKEDERICYGYVEGFEKELGYFDLDEIKSIKGSLGLPVERDISFKPIPLSRVKKS